MAVASGTVTKPAARRRALAETLAYLTGAVPRILTLVALLAAGAALPVAASYGMKTALDALPIGDQSMFARGLVVLVVAFAAAAILGAAGAKLRTTILETIAKNQRNRIAATALSLPLLETDRLERGDVVSRLSADVTEASKLVGNLYLTADIVLKAVAAAAYMLFLNIEVGLMVTGCNVVVVLATGHTTRGIPAKAKAYQGALGAMSVRGLNILEGRTVIKSFLAGERMTASFDERGRDVYWAGRRLAGVIAGATFWSVILAFLPLIAAFGFGGYMVAAGRLSFGGILAVLHLCDYFGPLALLGERFAQTQRSVGALDRVQEFVARFRPDADRPTVNEWAARGTAVVADPTLPAIQAARVSFGYSGAKPVLKDITLSVAQGAHVAIMGRSGSGKSTLLKVLAGLYGPTSGTVTVNGATYQPQEPFIFPGSIRDNLLVANADARDGAVFAALGSADAAEFVAGLEAGLDTEAGERGGRLSGGQRQRLALARTLLTGNPVLLLDEPTGSLDRDSELRVIEALQHLPGATWVMVTHRFETAAVCDQIVVMDDGTIAETGTHNELLAKRGLYWSLYTGESASRTSGERGDIA